MQVAASEGAQGLGCLVVMNDEIHAARFVRKVHTSSPAAFASPLSGPIGMVAEGAVRIFVRPERGSSRGARRGQERCLRRAYHARHR
ncbi:asparaginase domain-containing protein [Rubellimicrobium mesophilum]|uniref:asparaginase domain-containing protein n=1 Tax=Rubellimicrobium mesophilum TaxID=1123067 RepID=UPI001B80E4AF